jgi:hypothetical protein
MDPLLRSVDMGVISFPSLDWFSSVKLDDLGSVSVFTLSSLRFSLSLLRVDIVNGLASCPWSLVLWSSDRLPAVGSGFLACLEYLGR